MDVLNGINPATVDRRNLFNFIGESLVLLVNIMFCGAISICGIAGYAAHFKINCSIMIAMEFTR